MTRTPGHTASDLTQFAARLYVREMDAQLAAIGLTGAYLPVLFALAPLDEGQPSRWTQRDLARHAAVEQPTMANTLARMARDGWIERRPNPGDRRSALVVLSAHARAQLPAIRAVVSRVNARSLHGLGLEDAAALHALLGRVIANLQAG